MVEKKVEKRNRPPRSCEPCRLRKLKCNQELPCGSCVQRGLQSSCRYAANADRGEKRGKVAKTVSGRLKRLEDLIIQMAQGSDAQKDTQLPQAAPGTHPSTPVIPMLQRLPPITVQSNAFPPEPLSEGLLYSANSNYTDASHWSSLLEEIKDIREQLSSPAGAQPDSLEAPPPPASSCWSSPDDTLTDLVFGNGHLTLADLIKALPPRAICDRLVSFYFRLCHAIVPVLHPPTFQNEVSCFVAGSHTLLVYANLVLTVQYALFWDSPGTIQPLWLALLFAILAVAAGVEKLAGATRSGHSIDLSSETMGEYARQCLVLGNYVSVNKHSMEALIVLLQSNYFCASDTKPNLWFFLGIVIRLAVRRGYHRDPAKLPNSQLSPFDAEMRRRIWVTVFQVDSLMSFQMGLPSMIPWDYCDTELPRNLEYTDLAPGMAQLPPSRPLTDSTSILYTIVKARIMTIFKSIVDDTRSLAPRSYGNTMNLDADLRRAYTGLPDNFKYRPLDACLIDTVKDIMNRTTIELLYLKCLIVLHRKYIRLHRLDAHYATSRHACISAAYTTLQRQVELHGASQPGAPFFDSQWMISTLTVNDFILAAMVLCLEVTIRIKENNKPGSNLSGSLGMDTLLDALRSAHGIWNETANTSTEARTAVSALEATIERAAAHKSVNDDKVAGVSDAGSFNLSGSMLADMDFINWTFLDNSYSDPLDNTLDIDTWMLYATKG